MTDTIEVEIFAESSEIGRSGQLGRLEVSATALDAVRWNFNPSGDPAVTLIKALSAALITACENLRDGPTTARSRWAAIAITQAETAQMFAVKAATWTPPKTAPAP